MSATPHNGPRWAERAGELDAEAAPPELALPLLTALWASGRLVPALDDAAWARLAGRLSFARVGAGRTLINQDEPGDFLLVLLDGSVLIEHHGEATHERSGRHAATSQGTARSAQPRSALRLGQARPGDVLGEMALLDAGPRSSACTTLTPCLLAALEMDALAALMHDDPVLAAALMAALARRLSLRLRHADARLAALLAHD